MTRIRPARRLTIIVDEDSTVHRKPVYTEIVHRAHAAGLAGASVFRGIEGYGASQRVHTSRLLSLAENLPALIVIVDTAENIDRFVPQLAELGVRGVITIEDVDLVDLSSAQNPTAGS